MVKAPEHPLSRCPMPVSAKDASLRARNVSPANLSLALAGNGEQRDAVGIRGIDEGREPPSSRRVDADEQEHWLGAVIVGILRDAAHLGVIGGARSRHATGMIMPLPHVVGTQLSVPTT